MSLATIISGTAGLVGYWKGNDAVGSSTLVDSVSARNGTILASTKAGVHGFDNVSPRAIFFDGNNLGTNGITIPYAAALFPTSGTYEFCVRIQKENRGYDVYAWSRQVANTNAYLVWLDNTGGGSWALKFSQDSTTVCTSTASISDTHTWHHCAVVFDDAANTCVLYLDGVDVSGSVTSFSLGANTNGFNIGSDYQMYSLCHMALYNTKLTAIDIKERWEAVKAESFATKEDVTIGLHDDSIYYGSGSLNSMLSNIRSSASLRSEVSRNSIVWPTIEPTNGATKDWTSHDAIVNYCNQNNINPLWVFNQSPTWANGGGTINTIPGTGVDSTFTTWVERCVTFVTAFVNRYKPGGTGTYTIKDPFWFEIWNEPNLSGFWTSSTGGYNVDQFAYFYRRIRSAIKAEYPQIRPIMAGLSSWVATGGGVDTAGDTFLQGVIASSQWHSAPIEYAALHAYSDQNNPDDMTQFNNHYNDVLSMHDRLALLGYPNTPIAMTEQGVTDGTSQADQATKMNTMITRVRDEWSSFVPLWCWFLSYGPGGTYTTNRLFTSMPSDGTVSTSLKTAATTFKSLIPADPLLPAQGDPSPWGDSLIRWLLTGHNRDGTNK